MPHVAALLGVNQVSDIMSVEGSHTFRRPVYAGNAIVTVEAPQAALLLRPCASPPGKAPPAAILPQSKQETFRGSAVAHSIRRA